jgi:type I restriction enzyme S subunit
MGWSWRTSSVSESNKILKSGWKIWRFDQIAANVNVRIDNPSESGMEHYVGLEHLDPDSLKIRRWGRPDDVEATKLVFKKGDIIFGRRRAYQRKLGVAEFDGICSAHAMVLRAKPEVVLPEFLPFFMQSDLFMNRAIEISVGSLSPTINWKALAAQPFSLPPVEQQRSIVTAMQTVDDAIDAYTNLASRANSLLTSLREDIFSDHAVAGTLDELLIDIQAGKSFVGVNQPPSDKNEKAVLKVSAIGKNGFVPAETKVLLDQSQFLPAHAVRNHDVLITRANTPDLVGMVCLVEGSFPNLMLCDKTLRLVPRSDVAALLLSECLKTISSRQYLKANATGTGGAMKNISQGKLRTMPIRFPSVPNRARAEMALSEATSAYRAAQVRLLSGKKMRDSMLSKLIGEGQ